MNTKGSVWCQGRVHTDVLLGIDKINFAVLMTLKTPDTRTPQETKHHQSDKHVQERAGKEEVIIIEINLHFPVVPAQ